MKFLGVPGAFDYAGPTRARAIAIVRVAFRTCLLRRRPGCIFSQLNLPPRLFPCLRFAVHLAMPNAKLGAKVDRYSFFVRLLPPLVGSRTGAMLRRFSLSVAPRFLWECLTSQTVSSFPVPASSNPSCRFPAMGLPACFVSGVMGPLRLVGLSRVARIGEAGTRGRVLASRRAILYSTGSIRSLVATGHASSAAESSFPPSLG